MPKIPDHHTDGRPHIGDFYVNRGTGALVEIMDVDLDGNAMVLDVTAPLDGDWQPLTPAQLFSCFWVRLSDHAAAA
jgi:hypothetical protein